MLDKNTVRNLLSYLDNKTFTEFIYEFWCSENIITDEKFVEISKLYNISKDVFEQVLIDYKDDITGTQSHNLILPFYEPLELYAKPEKLNFNEHPYLYPILSKYRRKVSKRENNWNIFRDGDYTIPTIAFVSNIAGFKEEYYQKYLLPSLALLVEQAGLFAMTKIGTCDSFVDLDFNKTAKILKEFLNKRKKIVISNNEGRVSVNEYFSEKYLTGGILQTIDSPLYPIYVNNIDANSLLLEFQSLLAKKSSESQLESFIKKYYKTLFGPHYTNIETQLWLKFPELDISSKNRRLDVFLKNSIENDWELLELKQISNPIKIVQGVPNFTSRVYSAIEQLKNYNNILQQSSVKQKLSKLGITYFEPEYKIVIDKKPDISTEQWRRLKKNNENGFKILTLEDIYAEVNHRCSNKSDLE
ncbi:MAG: hypothetical protein ABI113_10075 [Mucilaginibacter sp.]